MAITINTQITGQQAGSDITYCYFNEPLKITISDNDVLVKNIFADLTKINTKTGVAELPEVKYITSDIAPGGVVTIDLSEVIKQAANLDFYKIQDIDDIFLNDGWKNVVSEYIYKLEFYTDKAPAVKTVVQKLPIFGGRYFGQFTPTVNHTNSLTEITFSEMQLKDLGGYDVIGFDLKDITLVLDDDYSPTVTKLTIPVTQKNVPCMGVIHWKSKLGGWLSWGMDIKTEKYGNSYKDTIEIENFRSTNILGGDAYIPVNYTGVASTKSIVLKSINRSTEELMALSQINGSPTVYYQETPTSKWELMRITSISAPIDSLSNGGTFSISLNSIIENFQKVI